MIVSCILLCLHNEVAHPLTSLPILSTYLLNAVYHFGLYTVSEDQLVLSLGVAHTRYFFKCVRALVSCTHGETHKSLNFF